MVLKLKNGDVKIELFSDVAPNHVERIKTLANEGKYDNVVFHRSEEHTSELQSRRNLVCRLLLEKKKKINKQNIFWRG